MYILFCFISEYLRVRIPLYKFKNSRAKVLQQFSLNTESYVFNRLKKGERSMFGCVCIFYVIQRFIRPFLRTNFCFYLFVSSRARWSKVAKFY